MFCQTADNIGEKKIKTVAHTLVDQAESQKAISMCTSVHEIRWSYSFMLTIDHTLVMNPATAFSPSSVSTLAAIRIYSNPKLRRVLRDW